MQDKGNNDQSSGLQKSKKDWDDHVSNDTEKFLQIIEERNKELQCHYEVNRILLNYQDDLKETYQQIVNTLPSAFSRPDQIVTVLTINDQEYFSGLEPLSEHFIQTTSTRNDIKVQIKAAYVNKDLQEIQYRFLDEEMAMIKNLCERL